MTNELLKRLREAQAQELGSDPTSLGMANLLGAAADKLDFVLQVLDHFSGHTEHSQDDLWWRTDGQYAPVTFFINCNDIFLWGCSDCEQITPENFPVLVQAYKDSEDHGGVLFVARVRGMRPQGAWYSYCDKEEWPLFHACGPEREVGFGNPTAPGDYKIPTRTVQPKEP